MTHTCLPLRVLSILLNRSVFPHSSVSGAVQFRSWRDPAPYCVSPTRSWLARRSRRYRQRATRGWACRRLRRQWFCPSPSTVRPQQCVTDLHIATSRCECCRRTAVLPRLLWCAKILDTRARGLPATGVPAAAAPWWRTGRLRGRRRRPRHSVLCAAHTWAPVCRPVAVHLLCATCGSPTCGVGPRPESGWVRLQPGQQLELRPFSPYSGWD